MSIFLFFVFLGFPIVTDGYLPLKREAVACSNGGHLYVLNTLDCRVDCYNRKGILTNQFGRRGQGPGEMTVPSSLSIVNEQIVVCDSGFVNFYSLKGESLRRLRTGQVQSKCLRAEGGWVTHSMGYFSPDGIEVRWHDDEFETTTVLTTLPNSPTNTRVYNPANDDCQFVSTSDGEFVFFRGKDSAQILVLDGKKGEIINTISPKISLKKFNTIWGEKQFENYLIGIKSNYQSRGLAFNRHDYVAAFPDYFPPVRRILTDHENSVVVVEWTESPDQIEKIQRFSPHGDPLPVHYSFEAYRRMLAVFEDYAYVAIYDVEEETAGIAKVGLEDVNAFVADRPIEFTLDSRRVFGR